MVFGDWSSQPDYAFTAGLDAAQWAWEFLRRNPRYQADWQAQLEWAHRLRDGGYRRLA